MTPSLRQTIRVLAPLLLLAAVVSAEAVAAAGKHAQAGALSPMSLDELDEKLQVRLYLIQGP